MKSQKVWPLRLLLSSQFALVAIIPLLVVGLLLVIFLLPKTEQARSLDQKALANSISGQVKAYLDNAATDMKVLASFSIQTNFPDDSIEELLDLYASNQSYFEAIYLTDDEGYIEHIGLPDYQQYLRPNFLNMDISHSKRYQQARSSGRGVWTETFLSAVSRRRSVAYAQPLLDGVIIGEISVDELPRLVFNLAAQYDVTVMILDRNRQLIAHPNPDYSLQQLNLNNLELVKRTDSGDNISLPFQFQEDDLVGTAAIIPELNWMVIAAQNRLQVEAEQNAVNQILLAAILIGLIAAAVTGSLLSKEFMTGFAQHTKQAKALAQGEYQIDPKPSRIRELNWLGENLKVTSQAIKEREEELVARQNRFRALVEQSPLAIIEWSTDFSVSTSNQLARDLLGLDEEDNQDCAICRLKELVTLRLTMADTVIEELCAQVHAEEHILLSYNTTIHNFNGEVISYLSLVQDVTQQRNAEQQIRQLNADLEQRVEERTEDLRQSNTELHQAMLDLKRTQDELIQSEKLAALGSLVAGVSHELNTPIGNSLMASSTLAESSQKISKLLQNNKLTKTDFDHFIAETESGNQILIRNLERASELIKSFKQIAVDQSSSQQRSFELKQLLDEILITLFPMLKKTRIKVNLKIQQTIIMDSYPGALAQIITNLVQNAVVHAFTEKNPGIITISAETTNENQVLLSITDNGLGIPHEKQSSIFDPFYTTKLGQGGSGLGLHIVHNLVNNLLQGTISVSSELGQGTCMQIQIPCKIDKQKNEKGRIGDDHRNVLSEAGPVS